MPPLALVREVTDSFASALTRHAPVPPLDPERARRQHAAYRDALAAGGFAIRVVPGDETHPDGCFIEDSAVVIGATALISRSGHPSRRGEGGPVAGALSEYTEVEHMEAGTLDGGDVLQVGATVFVGVGRRTDAAGAEVLAAVCRREARRLVPVPAAEPLHLKSAVSALDGETVLWHPAAGSRDLFGGLRVVEASGDDPEAANVVRLPDGRVLCAAGHESTAAIISGLGYEVASCDVSEFRRADGGLSCLSIRLR